VVKVQETAAVYKSVLRQSKRTGRDYILISSVTCEGAAEKSWIGRGVRGVKLLAINEGIRTMKRLKDLLRTKGV